MLLLLRYGLRSCVTLANHNIKVSHTWSVTCHRASAIMVVLPNSAILENTLHNQWLFFFKLLMLDFPLYSNSRGFNYAIW